MPFNASRYPPDWNQFSKWVRFVRAAARCECTGQCRQHRTLPTPTRCVEVHGRPAVWARGTVRLTVAHLCDCQPLCKDPAHVLAMCQKCHLRLDLARHLATRKARRAAQAGFKNPKPSQ